MLRDITIGQHFPGNSVLHTLRPPRKAAGSPSPTSWCCLWRPTPWAWRCPLPCWRRCIRWPKSPASSILKSLKPIVPIVLFTAVLNLFFVTGEGEPLCPHLGVENLRGGHPLRHPADGARLRH